MKTKFLLNKFSSKGFTLVELLVVIAVIGIMAAAVLIAINPVAKINQAKDGNVKSDVSQLANALTAYYVGSGGASYPTVLTGLIPSELKTLPPQQTGNHGCITASGSDDTSYCYGVSGTNVAIWGALFSPATRTFYCWDSTTGTYHNSTTAVAGQTTCP